MFGKGIMPQCIFMMAISVGMMRPAAVMAQGDQIKNILDFVDETVEEASDTSVRTDVSPQPITAGISEPEFRLKLLTGLGIATPIILLMVLVALYFSKGTTAGDLIHATGLILIINATIFVVLATVNREIFTAAIGVLGAIAGYLFGRSNVPSISKSRDN